MRAGAQLVAKSGELDVAISKVFRFEYPSQATTTVSLDRETYLPLALGGTGASVPPCYAYRVCCENVDPCGDRLYLPLMVDVPGAPEGGE